MNKENRLARKEALDAIRQTPKGLKDAFRDLLQCELARAWAELETARETIEIWRAQGRVMEIRDLLQDLEKDG